MAARLRADGYRARTVTLKLRLPSFSTLTRSKTMPDPTDVGADLYHMAAELFAKLPAGRRRFRLIGVAATNLVPAGAEQVHYRIDCLTVCQADLPIDGAARHRVAKAADLLDRTRLQIIRIDQMVTGMVEKAQSTAGVVEQNVMTPVHEVSALIAGVRKGLEFLFARRRSAAVSESTQDEQMFI